MLDQAIHSLAFASGVPAASGTIRASAEDFLVKEIPLIEPAGAGEHAWIRLRKRYLTTALAAKRLAEHAGVDLRQVGYAGLKDRNAVTEQWFSVQLPGRADPDWSLINDDDISVLQTVRHTRKLQRGALAGNSFKIRVRNMDADRASLEQRMLQVQAAGVPNYFGEQRFGRAGSNLRTAQQLFNNPRRRLSRNQRSMALSAARSLLFNRVLSKRIEMACWDRPLAGDALQLDGSNSYFVAPGIDDDICKRAASMDIHPTGPLCGRGTVPVREECLALESGVIADNQAMADGLAAAGVRHDRRSLRVVPKNFGWRWPAEGCLELSFDLPPGSFATAVLRELLVYRDASAA